MVARPQHLSKSFLTSSSSASSGTSGTYTVMSPSPLCSYGCTALPPLPPPSLEVPHLKHCFFDANTFMPQPGHSQSPARTKLETPGVCPRGGVRERRRGSLPPPLPPCEPASREYLS